MNRITPRPEPALDSFDHDGTRIAIRHRPAIGDRPTVLFLRG
jgi:hypothetical protein